MRISVFLMLITVLLTACTKESLRDNVTKQDIEKINLVDGMTVYYHGYDNMDRGNHEFDGFDIVVDQTYYQSNSIQRGDIIYYSNPELANSNIKLGEQEI